MLTKEPNKVIAISKEQSCSVVSVTGPPAGGRVLADALATTGVELGVEPVIGVDEAVEVGEEPNVEDGDGRAKFGVLVGVGRTADVLGLLEPEADGLIEAVIEIVPLTEEVMEIEPVMDDVMETVPVTEGVTEMDEVTEEVMEIVPVTEGVIEIDAVLDGVIEIVPVTEGVTEIDAVLDGVIEIVPVTEGVTDIDAV